MSINRNPVKEEAFKEIKQFLATHREVMLQHLRMLNEVVKGNVSNEEFADYLEDVIGITRKISLQEKVKIIFDLRQRAERACKMAIKLSTLMNEDMTDREVNSLSITLKYLLEDGKKEERQFNGKSTPWDYKSVHAFNLCDISRFCFKKLEPHQPDSFKKLDSICEIDTKYFNIQTNNKKVFEYNFRTDILFKTDRLTGFYKSKRSPIHEHVFELRFNKMQSENFAAIEVIDELGLNSEITYTFFELLNKKNEIVNQLGKFGRENKPNVENIEEIISYIHATSLYVSDLIFIMDGMKLNADSVADFLEEEKNILKFTENTKQRFSKEFEKVDKKLIDLLKEIKLASLGAPIEARKTLSDYIKLVNDDQEGLEREKSKWFGGMSFTSLLGARLASDFTSVMLESMSKDILNVNQYLKLLVSQENEKSDMPNISESSSSEKSDVENEERRIFRQRKKEEAKVYKEKVEADRILKLAEKSHIIASVSSSSIFLEKAVEKVANEDLQPLLQALHPDQIQMLRDIINQNVAAKIDYADVYHLIINHLGGTVQEIGNGSSHKRIRIGKFYTEMSSDRDTVSLEEVTGGIYKPHGKSHNKGLLSRFNLELVGRVLEKAGITLEVLVELEKKVVDGKLNF